MNSSGKALVLICAMEMLCAACVSSPPAQRSTGILPILGSDAAAQGRSSGPMSPALNARNDANIGDTAWFCPMHPDVTALTPGVCSVCGMRLISGRPFDTREYLLDFSTQPAQVEAGLPTELNFGIRDPASGELVREYEDVHTKPYHLFVISQDLSSFQHVHPVLSDAGIWQVSVTLPSSGYYRVLSDFVPKGGSPQVIGRPLVTADYDGDLLSSTVIPIPDAEMRKTEDGITAQVEFEPRKLVAGQLGHLTFTLRDADTQTPIEDLQPYLGAFGHAIIASSDLVSAVHVHPNDEPANNVERGIGGPTVTFEGYFPTPGIYRSWTQFQRNGQVSTFTFTFKVFSTEEAFADR